MIFQFLVKNVLYCFPECDYVRNCRKEYVIPNFLTYFLIVLESMVDENMKMSYIMQCTEEKIVEIFIPKPAALKCCTIVLLLLFAPPINKQLPMTAVHMPVSLNYTILNRKLTFDSWFLVRIIDSWMNKKDIKKIEIKKIKYSTLTMKRKILHSWDECSYSNSVLVYIANTKVNTANAWLEILWRSLLLLLFSLWSDQTDL